MKNPKDTPPKNKQSNHKKESSYGGYGGNSPANMDAAINEFEDELTENHSKDSTDEEEIQSETNNPETETASNTSDKKDSDLDKKRAETFDRIKKDPKNSEKDK